ncbi:MAG: rhodanese-like domain-containing protein [Ferruginibacter sp.]
MIAVKYLSLFVVLVGSITACSNSSASCDNCTTDSNTVLPKAGKTSIVDVCTVDEWNNDDHADCSVNYPLHQLGRNIETLNAHDKAIVVCRCDNKANAAKELLEQRSIKEIENKGAWQNIACK